MNIGTALAFFLDVLSIKRSDELFAKYAKPGDPDYAVHRAAWTLQYQREYSEAGELLRKHWEKTRSVRIGADWCHFLLANRRFDEARDVAEELISIEPSNPWLWIFLGDIYHYFIKDADKALETFEKARPWCEKALPNSNPLAICLKRLLGLYRAKENHEAVFEVLNSFYELGTTNFHADEFIMLAEECVKRGMNEKAKEVLLTASEVMPREHSVREAYKRLGFGDPPPLRPRRKPVKGIAEPYKYGIEAVPVKTRLLVEGDDPAEVVASYVSDLVQPGDIVTLSSCVAGLMEGRMLMEGTVKFSKLALFLSKLVSTKEIPKFGATTPMANPLSVQTLLEEIGTLRVILAAVAGALGRLLRIRGWFYVVAGPQSALIDDIMGSIPPYDYYVILGPKDPHGLSEKIAKTCGAYGAAIVDANDLGIAWAVGYSSQVNAKKLEAAMASNPAGNQEQQTPVVIMRNVDKLQY